MKIIRVGIFGDRIDGQWCSPSYQIRLLNAWEDVSWLKVVLLHQVTDIKDVDVIIFQRLSFLDAVGRDLLAASVEQGVPRVLDIDDDFDAVSRTNGHEAQNQLAMMINNFNDRLHCFSQIWVSTEPLGRKISETSGMPVRLRPTVPPKSIELCVANRRERVRVKSFLYFGTSTHVKDFEMVQAVLAKEACQERIQATVVGVLHGSKSSEGVHSIGVSRKIATRYSAFIDHLSRLGPFEVGVAPLAINEVNRSKSGLKVLEYAALGILPLASDVEAYGWMKGIELEELLIPAGLDNWQDKIRQIAEMEHSEFENLRLNSISVINQYSSSLREMNLSGDLESFLNLI